MLTSSVFDWFLDGMIDQHPGWFDIPEYHYTPAIDIRTTGEAITIAADIPGVLKENLEVTLENTLLTIKGERKSPWTEKDSVRIGRKYGPFRKTFTLPEGLDADELKADLTDGVLTIQIPRKSAAKPRKVLVQ